MRLIRSQLIPFLLPLTLSLLIAFLSAKGFLSRYQEQALDWQFRWRGVREPPHEVAIAAISGLASLVYSTYLGGSGDDLGIAITVDAAGNAYVIGTTHSGNFPTANPLDAVLSGPDDVFVAKLDASGSTLLFSTYLGGSGSDRGRGIVVGPTDSLYIAGFTSSTDFPTVNPFQGSYGGGAWNAFVAIIEQ
jgi:hypothetical protein